MHSNSNFNDYSKYSHEYSRGFHMFLKDSIDLSRFSPEALKSFIKTWVKEKDDYQRIRHINFCFRFSKEFEKQDLLKAIENIKNTFYELRGSSDFSGFKVVYYEYYSLKKHETIVISLNDHLVEQWQWKPLKNQKLRLSKFRTHILKADLPFTDEVRCELNYCREHSNFHPGETGDVVVCGITVYLHNAEYYSDWLPE